MMQAGDARKGTGLAGRIVSAMRMMDPSFRVQYGAPFADALAQAIVAFLQEDVEVSVDIPSMLVTVDAGQSVTGTVNGVPLQGGVTGPGSGGTVAETVAGVLV